MTKIFPPIPAHHLDGGRQDNFEYAQKYGAINQDGKIYFPKFKHMVAGASTKSAIPRITRPQDLVAAATKGGIAAPEMPERINDRGMKERYPHFFALCEYQLGREPAHYGEEIAHAEMIATFSVADLDKIDWRLLGQKCFVRRSK